MLKFNLSRALRLRGIENHVQFLKQNGFVSSSAYNLLSGEAPMIKFEKLEKLCLALNCTPNDLFEWRPSAGQSVSAAHPLNNLKKKDLPAMLNEIPLDKLEEIVGILHDKER